jgi:hypothetical protein
LGFSTKAWLRAGSGYKTTAFFHRIDRDAAKRIRQRRQHVAADTVAIRDGQRWLLVGLVVADGRAMARQDQRVVAAQLTFRMCRPSGTCSSQALVGAGQQQHGDLRAHRGSRPRR